MESKDFVNFNLLKNEKRWQTSLSQIGMAFFFGFSQKNIRCKAENCFK